MLLKRRPASIGDWVCEKLEFCRHCEKCMFGMGVLEGGGVLDGKTEDGWEQELEGFQEKWGKFWGCPRHQAFLVESPRFLVEPEKEWLLYGTI